MFIKIKASPFEEKINKYKEPYQVIYITILIDIFADFIIKTMIEIIRLNNDKNGNILVNRWLN